MRHVLPVFACGTVSCVRGYWTPVHLEMGIAHVPASSSGNTFDKKTHLMGTGACEMQRMLFRMAKCALSCSMPASPCWNTSLATHTTLRQVQAQHKPFIPCLLSCCNSCEHKDSSTDDAPNPHESQVCCTENFVHGVARGTSVQL